MRTPAIAVVICLLLVATLPAADQTAADRMFNRLSGLTGEWEGTLEWSGGRTGTGTLTANYYLTGNGSSLVENLVMSGDIPSMTSVYHLDGTDLRMTHYCAARNQPRLKASKIDEAGGLVQFSFVDATNLAASPGHVHAAEIRLIDADHINIKFTFEGGKAKPAVEDIKLQRAKAAAPTTAN